MELAERLVGEPFRLVDSDGAPRAGRRIGIWNPPVIDSRSMTRRSVLSEAAELLADLVSEGVRTICFLRSRRGIELIQRFARTRLEELGRTQLAERIAPYRAGYTPQQRREIEARLAAGELLAVVATDALELGIDIGELDAAICVTFPGTVASLRQMWGRAGRRSEGLALYVAGEDALDQFFCRHPEEFLERPVEAAILDHENERIQLAHLLAAAYEVPLSDADAGCSASSGGSEPTPWSRSASCGAVGTGATCHAARGSRPATSRCARRRRTRWRSWSEPPASSWGWSRPSVPSPPSIPARSTCTSGARTRCASSTSRPGARWSIPSTVIGTRSPRRRPKVFIERIVGERREAGGIELSFGEVSVTEQVMAFQRKRLSDHQVVDMVGLDLPETNFPTQALWYVLGEELAGPAALPPEVLLGALHAAEHGQIAVLPLLAMCDRWDIGGLSTNVHFQTGRPTIFIYDGYPGGVGIARRGFEWFERLVADAAKLIGECPCADGCPSCVQSPKCGNLNEPLHKQGALELMTAMLSQASGAPGLMERRRQVAVIGKGTPDEELTPLAEEVGRLLAEAGAVVVCGGLTGVMEGVARGASAAGGTVIGIVPSSSQEQANQYCTHVVATGIGHARNLAVVSSGDAVIAIGGEWGTLSEIAFARELGRRVVALSSWTMSPAGEMEGGPGIEVASTPAEAVELALSGASKSGLTASLAFAALAR